MNKSSDQPETSGHGYTEDDVRIVAESLRFAATEPYGDLLMNADRAAGLAVAALAGAGRLRDTRDHATDFAAVSGYDLGIEEGRRQMEAELRAAGRLLPADTRTEYGTFWNGIPSVLFADLAEAREFVADKQPLYPEHGEVRVRLVGPWLPVSPNPEITDNPAGTVSGNGNPDGSPDTKEEPDAAPTAAVDLMAALKASMERARPARSELTGAQEDTGA